ncbi:MAG TPA: DUF58 domain-containing protein, partial [Burkholderiales bacterium]|nr:DUF58 domain-containing protein [Burkholderiales bacterium]
RVDARRELPRYATAGEEFVYRVTVTNRGAKPLSGASIAERFCDPRPSYDEWRAAREPGEQRRNWFDREAGYFRWRWLIERRIPQHATHAALPPLAPGESSTVRLSFQPRRRGRIELAGLDLAHVDPLGMVKGLARVPLQARVVALPRRYRIPQIALPGARKFQQGGVSLSAAIGDSQEFLSLRDYRPGDPLQHLHWKSFARTGKPIVKEYQDEFFERHALVLDTGSAGGEDAAFEEAVAVAASFVHTIDSQECLLDLLFVGGDVKTFTAGRGLSQAEQMLEVLAGVNASAPSRFAELARTVLSRRTTISSIIAVLLAWDEPRRRFIAEARASGLDVRALLVTESTQPIEVPGVLVLRPGEIQQGLASLQ